MKNWIAYIVLWMFGLAGVVAQTNNLLVSSGTNVVVSGNSLVVENAISNAGTITLESGANLVQKHTGADNNTVSGNFEVKRTGSNNILVFNIWSSPISYAGLMGTFSGEICDMWTFKASEQEWKWDFPIGAAPDLCWGANKTFVANELVAPDATADGVMDVGRGYYVTGNTTDTRTFYGAANNGDLTTTIYATSSTSADWSGTNWNLVGNPYPSALDKSAFWTENAGVITDGVYFWGSTDTLYDQCGDFTVWNPLGQASSSCNSSSTGASYNSIASGQGFWVYCSSTAGSTETVTFKNSMRNGVDNTGFYKNKEEIHRAWLSTRYDTIKSNQLLLGLVDDATMGYDPYYDAHAFEDGLSNFLTFTRYGDNYLILAEPEPEIYMPYNIPLTYKSLYAGVHYFQIDSIHEINAGLQYILYDDLFKTSHVLNDGAYAVSLDVETYENRFYLMYQDNMPNGISELEKNTFKVSYFNQNIQITYDATENYDIRVISLNGTQFMSQHNNQNVTHLHTQNWPAGMYVIQCEDNTGYVESHKVVVH